MDSPDELLAAIYKWVDDNDKADFNTNFIDSLSKQYEERGTLSDRQMDALTNIYNKFKMGE